MSVDVQPVATRRDLKEFIELPYRLHSTSGVWVPPLKLERRIFLSRRFNAYFSHGDAQLFLARRDGRVVGRISAHVDHAYNEFHGARWGLWGFFECENDPETAAALLDAARDWLRDRGRDRMVGPMDFTTNDECGLLIEGHERKPLILEGWHHPYFLELLEGWGLRKAMDLYMWELRLDKVEDKGGFHPLIHATAKKVTGEHGVTVRHMRRRDLDSEIASFLEVYNKAWAHNWAFVPLDETEARWYSKNLRPVLDERWTWIAERDGEVLGAALTLPDINRCLEHMNGRLLPFGWA